MNEHFLKLKNNLELNVSFQEKVSQHYRAITSMVKNINPAYETKLIGSLQRQTRIQPYGDQNFDIDILVVLGPFTCWLTDGSGIAPQDALNTVHEIFDESDRYKPMAPQIDHPTITFEYEDGVKVELVPAYTDEIGHSPNGVSHIPVGRGYWVPKNGTWELADYDHDADVVTAYNKNVGGLLVPTIKMLKAIRRNLFPEMISPFHLEVIATHTITNLIKNGVASSYPDLIEWFFTVASVLVDKPIKLVGSNSPALELDQNQKTILPAYFKTLAEHCKSARGLTSESARAAKWAALFGEPFPLTSPTYA